MDVAGANAEIVTRGDNSSAETRREILKTQTVKAFFEDLYDTRIGIPIGVGIGIASG